MIEIDLDNQGNAIVSGDYFDAIREHFSAENPNARFLKRFNPYISSRTYAITPTGRCDPGIVLEIKKFLVSKSYADKVNISPSLLANLKPSATWNSAVYNIDPYSLNIPLRDYQEEIVKKCLTVGRGTVILATAGGKTLTMASLISRIATFYDKLRCIIIVPDRGLVEQTYSDFKEYGVPLTISKWTGDDELDTASNIVIANLGIMQSVNSSLDWTRHVNLLIVDEVHKIRHGNKVNSIIKKIKTPFKFGFTGTMPEDRIDQWNIIGKIGPVLFEKNSYELRLENYVANAEILCLRLTHKAKLSTSGSDNPYRAEVDYIVSSEFRNNTIAKIASRADNNCLIMVDYIKHGENLYNTCKNMCTNKQIFFIRGEVEVEEREQVRKLVEQNSNVIIVAISKIFSTGINIKNLHYIVFAGGGKAKVKIVQSIGRGLRLHQDKKKLIIVDISDNFKYSIRHADKRVLLYESERIKRTAKEITE